MIVTRTGLPSAPSDDTPESWSEYCEEWDTYWGTNTPDEDAKKVFHKAWRAHWMKCGQVWRTEPEINGERKEFLKKRLAIPPDNERGIYPFKDIRLSRADVEWVLASHHEGDWLAKMIMHPIGTGVPKRGLDLRGADLSGADLHRLPLAELRGGLMSDEWEEADETVQKAAGIHLEGADLSHACLKGASLRSAHLEGAKLEFTDLDGASLRGAHMKGASLRFAFVDHATSMRDVVLEDCCSVVDVRWDAVDLEDVKWSVRLKSVRLGDEREAKDAFTRDKNGQPKRKDWARRQEDYQATIRANRQLAQALQQQGINDKASHFAYRAQVLQRGLLGRQALRGDAEFLYQPVSKWHKVQQRAQSFVAWLFSLSLGVLGGYGHKFSRLVAWYFLTLLVFAAFYYFFTPASLGIHIPGFGGAFVTSLAVFHGRPFLQIGEIGGSQYIALNLADCFAIGEALFGLVLEGIAIAMLAQRFMCKSGS